MVPSFHIRPARAAECAALSQIALDAKARWGYPEAWLATWAAAELTLTPMHCATGTVLVAESASDLLGVGAITLMPSGRDAPCWSLEHLWVRPEAAGRGVGRALYSALLAAVRTGGGGRMEVLADPHAAGFYERLGATRAGAVPAPMPGAPDRVLPRFEHHVPAAP
jgi:GNAT superfamily N-acetyltransferase